MLIQSAEPLNLVRVGQSPWQESGEDRVWYRVAVSKKATPCKDCHLAPVPAVPHLSAHL